MMIFTVVLFVVKFICCICTEPKEGDVRLVDGTNQFVTSEGRVDIFLDGEWGTICDVGWDIFDAYVVCRQLGFESARTAYPRNAYPSGDSLPIHVKDVFCIGYEKSVYECFFHRHSGRCVHSEDATLACNTFRLSGGENDAVGQVEALLPHPVAFCQDSFDKTSAEHVCAELGYSGVEDYNCCAHTENETTSLMEYATTECIISNAGKPCEMTNETCPSQGYASVNCSVAPVRIIPVGINPLEGRLEVLLNGTWGSVCSELWNNKSAAVACRQLGNFELKPVNALRFSGDIGINTNVAFDNLCCIGDEHHIERCPIKTNGLDAPSCDNVGMVCTDTRLVGGRPGFPEGRVEVVSNRQWGSVCADSWTIQNADVVCRQLFDVPAYSTGDFGQGFNDVVMSKVDCVGDESSLTKCSYLRHTDDSNVCNTNLQAGVICQDLRLRSATNSSNEGRVEIMVDGKWGSICGHGWSIKEANVVCRQLGHCSALRSGIGEHRLGLDQMHWTSISCLGNEAVLRDCKYETGNGPCFDFLFEADATCIDSCPDLRAIANLIVEFEMDEFRPGDKTIVRCEEEFVLVGSHEMTCLHGCHWNSNMPFCAPSSLLKSTDDSNNSFKSKSSILIAIVLSVVFGIIVLLSLAVYIRHPNHNIQQSGDSSASCFRHHKTSGMSSNNYEISGRHGTYETIGPRPIIYYQGMIRTDDPQETATDAGYEIPNATYLSDVDSAPPSFCTFVF